MRWTHPTRAYLSLDYKCYRPEQTNRTNNIQHNKKYMIYSLLKQVIIAEHFNTKC